MAHPQDHADLMTTAITLIVESVLRSPCVRHQIAAYVRDEIEQERNDAVYEFEDERRRADDAYRLETIERQVQDQYDKELSDE
jgi:hypothetical protein